MTQHSKKTPSSQHSAKLASSTAAKAAKNTYQSTKAQAENVVKFGRKTVKDLIATGSDEAHRVHQKALDMGREGAEHFAQAIDKMSKVMAESVSMSRDNMETCLECGNLTASLARDVTSEIFESANRAFSDHIELSKEFFACRTINDMFELQNRMARHTMDMFFNESVRLSGMVFEYTSEALEPINERIADATEKFSKALAA